MALKQLKVGGDPRMMMMIHQILLNSIFDLNQMCTENNRSNVDGRTQLPDDDDDNNKNFNNTY